MGHPCAAQRIAIISAADMRLESVRLRCAYAEPDDGLSTLVRYPLLTYSKRTDTMRTT